MQSGLKDKSEVKPVPIVGAGPTGMTAAIVAGGESTTELPPTWKEQLSLWHGILNLQHIAPVPTQPEAKAQFDKSFGRGQSLVLVRPDAYLGFVGEQTALPSLIE